jgi:hypothetical protein
MPRDEPMRELTQSHRQRLTPSPLRRYRLLHCEMTGT